MDDSNASLTTQEGAAQIKNLLYPTQDQAAPVQQAEGPAEPSEQVTPEETALEGEQSEEISTEEPLYEVVVDGKPAQVTLEELIKGYQLEAHYTQKSQKLAEERKAIEAERSVLNGINQKFEQLNEVVSYLDQVNAYVEQRLPPEPDRSLLHSNPAAYIEQKEAREAAIRDLMTIRARQEQTRSHAQELVNQLQAEGARVISQKMPELATPEGASRLYTYLGQNYGYKPEQLNSNVDPNLFIIAEKARRFDEMQAKVANPTKAAPPRVVKQAARPRPVGNDELQKQKQAFKARPNERNAVNLIKNIMNNKT